ncbi:MAG: hypothetical protein ACLSGS_03340 [Adlercreutzia sp.]
MGEVPVSARGHRRVPAAGHFERRVGHGAVSVPDHSLVLMVGHAIGRKRLAPLVSGAYPIAVVAWFCWMAFVLNQPHPAWVASSHHSRSGVARA